MKNITVLDQNTIDKIAAGEVIERPASIVKELVENAIDAGAGAVTVEIKDGGISLIRITDNGEGIDSTQVPQAFLRHATSKITKVTDLLSVTSLGFRGEALSSIAAVCQVELITKTAGSLTGTRYLINGSIPETIEEIGAPEGTTFLVRNIFYNTPARQKFLKSAITEAGYISDLMERMALSHPEIAFKFINNNKTKLHTSGNTNLKDIIYGVYGREIAANLITINIATEDVEITGFIGKPVISRGNRNYENYFINGRYVKSSIISKAIEDAYKGFMMQHKYPFTALHFTISGDLLDINVHPTKMELRFADNEKMFSLIHETMKAVLSKREMIPEVTVSKKEKTLEAPQMKTSDIKVPEPFEKTRLAQGNSTSKAVSDILPKTAPETTPETMTSETTRSGSILPTTKNGSQLTITADTLPQNGNTENTLKEDKSPYQQDNTLYQQAEFFSEKLLSKENVKEHRLIGQVFDTYWIVEFKEKMYLIDQHAAHEKVLFERTMAGLAKKEFTSQQISPPLIFSLNMQEEVLLNKYLDNFVKIGFEIEPFGGKEYAIRAVPGNLFGLAQKELFVEMLDSLASETGRIKANMIDEKVALMSCKAAVKGNNRLSASEATALIDELLTLENPYNCPHGRPTIIAMTKYELEKKFKRIV